MSHLWEVKNSPINGKGVFAKVDFKPNDVIGTALEFQDPYNLIVDPDLKYHKARIKGKVRLYNITSDFGRYINHQSAPLDNSELKPKGKKMFLVAKSFIPVGTEITTDYDNNPPFLKPSESHFK